MTPVRTIRLVEASPPERAKLPVAPTVRASEAKVRVWAAPTWVDLSVASPPAKDRAPKDWAVPAASAVSKDEEPARVTVLAFGCGAVSFNAPWRTARALVPRLLSEERVSVPAPTLVRAPAPSTGAAKSTSLPAVLSSVAVTKVDGWVNVIAPSKRSCELALALT